MRSFKFFFHFNKNKKMMSLHFKKQCYFVKDIICKVPTNTKWNSRQPLIVMEGTASKVIINDFIEVAYIA